MNLFQDDIHRETERIKKNLSSNIPLSEEDLKIILLSELFLEESHEGDE